MSGRGSSPDWIVILAGEPAKMEKKAGPRP